MAACSQMASASRSFNLRLWTAGQTFSQSLCSLARTSTDLQPNRSCEDRHLPACAETVLKQVSRCSPARFLLAQRSRWRFCCGWLSALLHPLSPLLVNLSYLLHSRKYTWAQRLSRPTWSDCDPPQVWLTRRCNVIIMCFLYFSEQCILSVFLFIVLKIRKWVWDLMHIVTIVHVATN